MMNQMNKGIVSTILIISCVIISVNSNEYCIKQYTCDSANDVNLENVKHLLCYNTKCRPAKNCGQTTILCNTDKFRERMLDFHNKLRSETAMGRTKSNKTVANMKALSYDKEREYLAYCTASLCTGNVDDQVGCKFPSKNSSEKFIEHVLSVYQTYQSPINFDSSNVLEPMISNLFSVNYPLRPSYKYVGCSRRIANIKVSKRSAQYKFILSCAYGEDQQYPEIVDKPACSMCNSPDECNGDYKHPGLCGPVRTFAKDHFQTTYGMSAEEQIIYSKNGKQCRSTKIVLSGSGNSEEILALSQDEEIVALQDKSVEIVTMEGLVINEFNKMLENLQKKIELKNNSGSNEVVKHIPEEYMYENIEDYGLGNKNVKLLSTRVVRNTAWLIFKPLRLFFMYLLLLLANILFGGC